MAQRHAPIYHPATAEERVPRSVTAPFGAGAPLGRWFGIQVRADFSVLLIFALVLVNLGAGVFPSWHPAWPATLSWALASCAAVLFFTSILVHELAHALVGRTYGIPVRGITLFIFGGVAHIDEEPPHPRAELVMAVAGPLTSIAIGVTAGALAFTFGRGTIDPTIEAPAALHALGPLPTLLLWLGSVNVILALFNLVPAFPLDGGRVLRAVLWWTTKSFHDATRWSAALGQAFAFTLMTLGALMALGLYVPLFGTGLGQGLWLVLIGWFLNTAAKGSYQDLLIREALHGVPLSRIMRAAVQTIPPDLAVDSLISEHLLRSDLRCFPVATNGHLIGVVALSDVRRVPQEEWPRLRVAQIMTPAERVVTLRSTDDALAAMRLMVQKDIDQIPVMESGELRGLVRRQDLVRWLGLRLQTHMI